MIDKKFEANTFGCSGENKSPALKWSGAPKDTKSFVVTVYDPDAPTGSGFWHWFVYNIPANVTELPANAGAQGGANLPKGAAMNRIDYGFAAWGGVCPPEGDKPHRYIFTIYALKTDKLDLPSDATAAVAGFMTNANKIAQASFTAQYGRPAAKRVGRPRAWLTSAVTAGRSSISFEALARMSALGRCCRKTFVEAE